MVALDAKTIKSLTVAKLRDELKKRNLALGGLKKELQERLEQAILEEENRDDPVEPSSEPEGNGEEGAETKDATPHDDAAENDDAAEKEAGQQPEATIDRGDVTDNADLPKQSVESQKVSEVAEDTLIEKPGAVVEAPETKQKDTELEEQALVSSKHGDSKSPHEDGGVGEDWVMVPPPKELPPGAGENEQPAAVAVDKDEATELREDEEEPMKDAAVEEEAEEKEDKMEVEAAEGEEEGPKPPQSLEKKERTTPVSGMKRKLEDGGSAERQGSAAKQQKQQQEQEQARGKEHSTEAGQTTPVQQEPEAAEAGRRQSGSDSASRLSRQPGSGGKRHEDMKLFPAGSARLSQQGKEDKTPGRPQPHQQQQANGQGQGSGKKGTGSPPPPPPVAAAAAAATAQSAGTATDSVRIDNFLRPFTEKALRTLLEATGKIEKFWLSSIKTHCYVTFSSVEEAEATRQALHDLQWPPVHGKQLSVTFVSAAEVENMVLHGEKGGAAKPQANVVAAAAGAVPPAPKVAAPVVPPPPREKLPPPPRKAPEPPLPSLDDLFKKTKVKPNLYYLPLTDAQVLAKVGMKQENVQKPALVEKARR